jgi:hypothetical protein
MYRNLWLGILLSSLTLPVAATEIVLEGISTLGSNKKAFLSVDGQKVAIGAGEKVGKWTVEKIEQRSIFLRSADDPNELKELELQSRLSENPAPAGAIHLPPNSAPFAPPANPTPPPATTFQPPRIDPKTVPPGHHIVSTPFGDVLVKD